ncbi:telomere repeats-binding bouquet formation protein 2 [Protopterus annectens]|uniref:telomere repeats-binding bouquet formation protein 2 n=1 Tax=Protopterus annectens TaxID=7888 RepID=UPI001CFC3CAF|nr:telomere repeats-binding bouquet formation protein 2 [Protopterus annectens]
MYFGKKSELIYFFTNAEIRAEIGNFIWEQDTTSCVLEKVQHKVSTGVKCKSNKMSSKLERKQPNGQKDGSDSNSRNQKPRKKLGSAEKQSFYPLQHYPVNNMVSGYSFVGGLQKYSGELRDFIPGCFGYEAYHIQSELNISSGKTGVKRKATEN